MYRINKTRLIFQENLCSETYMGRFYYFTLLLSCKRANFSFHLSSSHLSLAKSIFMLHMYTLRYRMVKPMTANKNKILIESPNSTSNKTFSVTQDL